MLMNIIFLLKIKKKVKQLATLKYSSFLVPKAGMFFLRLVDCLNYVSIAAWCVKPEIEYGRLSVEKVRYVEPERITIQCESGYSMVGSEIITCSEDRTWYPEAPKCEWVSHTT